MSRQIGVVIIATNIVQLANGFFGTFISLRIGLENFAATIAGFVLSSYYAGFTAGAFFSGRIIERFGHIRAYAAFCGLVVAAAAVMPLIVQPVPWLALRVIVGFGCVGLFVTTESWLSSKAQRSERGRIFSIYRVGTFIALGLGQLLIGRTEIKTAAPFNIVIALFAVALVLVSTTRANPPQIVAVARLPYGRLTWQAPVAVAGAVLSGLIASAFYALVPVWMQGRGIDRPTIGLVMLAAVLGGLAFQIPVGWLSDRFNRLLVSVGGTWYWSHRCRRRTGPPAAHSPDDPACGCVFRRLCVDPLPCVCSRRTRSNDCRSRRRRQRPARAVEWTWLGARAADRHGIDGAVRH